MQAYEIALFCIRSEADTAPLRCRVAYVPVLPATSVSTDVAKCCTVADGARNAGTIYQYSIGDYRRSTRITLTITVAIYMSNHCLLTALDII
jgi:hypothetical protein